MKKRKRKTFLLPSLNLSDTMREEDRTEESGESERPLAFSSCNVLFPFFPQRGKRSAEFTGEQDAGTQRDELNWSKKTGFFRLVSSHPHLFICTSFLLKAGEGGGWYGERQKHTPPASFPCLVLCFVRPSNLRKQAGGGLALLGPPCLFLSSFEQSNVPGCDETLLRLHPDFSSQLEFQRSCPKQCLRYTWVPT